MEHLKRRLTDAFWFALALIFLLESWLWDHVKDWLRALGRALGVERFEARIAEFIDGLSPMATLAVFAVPAILVLPFKIGALALLAHGHLIVGAVAIAIAETLPLGVTAFLFDHCRPKLLQMPWFAQVYSLVLAARAWASELVAPARQKIHDFIAKVRAVAKALLGEGRSQFFRRLSLIRSLAKRKSDSGD